MAASITIVGLPGLLAGLDTLGGRLAIANRAAMQTSVHLVEAGAKILVPHKTGHLRSSIQTDVTGIGSSLQGTIGTDLGYARDVEEGTRAHDIAPLTASALMLPIAPMTGFGGRAMGFGGGRLSGAPRRGQAVAFFARVRHPGTRPYPYLTPALEDARVPIQAIFTAAAQKALAQIAADARATLALFGKL